MAGLDKLNKPATVAEAMKDDDEYWAARPIVAAALKGIDEDVDAMARAIPTAGLDNSALTHVTRTLRSMQLRADAIRGVMRIRYDW